MPTPSASESPITLLAAEAITKHQAIKIDSNGKAAVATANTDLIIGTADHAAASGDYVAVSLCQGRKVLGVASAAITAGAAVTATTGGKFVTWSTGAGAKHIAVTAAGADGDFFSLIGGVTQTA